MARALLLLTAVAAASHAEVAEHSLRLALRPETSAVEPLTTSSSGGSMHPPRLALRPETSAAEPLTKRSLQFILSPDAADANRTRYFLIETVPGSATGNSSQYVQLSLWVCAEPAAAATELVTPLIGTIRNGPFPAGSISRKIESPAR